MSVRVQTSNFYEPVTAVFFSGLGDLIARPARTASADTFHSSRPGQVASNEVLNFGTTNLNKSTDL